MRMLRGSRWLNSFYQRMQEQGADVAFKFMQDEADGELALDLVAVSEGLEMLIPIIGMQALRREIAAMVMASQKEMVPT